MNSLLFLATILSLCAVIYTRPSFMNVHIPNQSDNCEIWKGFGYALAGVNCESTIDEGCPVILKAVSEIIELATNFDVNKLMGVVYDVYAAYKAGATQYEVCGYGKHFEGAAGHLWNFVSNLFEKWSKAEPHLIAIVFSWFGNDYNQIGTCIAKAWKEIELM